MSFVKADGRARDYPGGQGDGKSKTEGLGRRVIDFIRQKSSIRLKMTLWLLATIILIGALSLCMFLLISSSVLRKTVRNYLLSAVDANTNKIEFVDEDAKQDESGAGGKDEYIYIRYGDGNLRIDEDYLDVINDVEIALYAGNGTMLYGRNPIARAMEGGPLEESRIYRFESEGIRYYVYDRKMNSVPGLWIRGVVPLSQERAQIADIMRIMTVFLPIIMLFI